MDIAVEMSNDPGHVLDVAAGFLASDPVAHNLILTLLHARRAQPEPGRYWIARDGGDVVGVVFQSPFTFHAATTPMDPGVAAAVAHGISDLTADLPGIEGEAATVAAFAGAWTEVRRVSARPTLGQRLYELSSPAAVSAGGEWHIATPDHAEFLVQCFVAFADEIGESTAGAAEVVARRTAAGELWVWVDREPVSAAGRSEPVAGVTRIGPVYTPPAARGRGYASALVAAMSREAVAADLRCILYTDLENPTSNGIYRSIGYRAVGEGLRYRFTAP